MNNYNPINSALHLIAVFLIVYYRDEIYNFLRWCFKWPVKAFACLRFKSLIFRRLDIQAAYFSSLFPKIFEQKGFEIDHINGQFIDWIQFQGYDQPKAVQAFIHQDSICFVTQLVVNYSEERATDIFVLAAHINKLSLKLNVCPMPERNAVELYSSIRFSEILMSDLNKIDEALKFHYHFSNQFCLAYHYLLDQCMEPVMAIVELNNHNESLGQQGFYSNHYKSLNQNAFQNGRKQ